MISQEKRAMTLHLGTVSDLVSLACLSGSADLDQPVNFRLQCLNSAILILKSNNYMKFFRFSTLLIVLFSATANAGNISFGDVNLIHFWSAIPGVMVAVGTMTDNDSCGRNDYYIIANTHPHFKQLYALILSAQISQKKVQVETNKCVSGFPDVVNVWISK